jgi:hypothetical protein
MENHPAMQISMIRGAGPLHQALQGERILSSSYRFGVGVGISREWRLVKRYLPSES